MSTEGGLQLDHGELEFLAARIRRLCHHFGYPVPDQDDSFIVGVAASLIGAVLTKLELEKRNSDLTRLDWLEQDMQKDEPCGIYFSDGHFRYHYLSSNAGGFGGGVSEYQSKSLREAIDAAIKGRDYE